MSVSTITREQLNAAIQKDDVARFILRKITEHFDRYSGRGPRPPRATSSSP